MGRSDVGDCNGGTHNFPSASPSVRRGFHNDHNRKPDKWHKLDVRRAGKRRSVCVRESSSHEPVFPMER